MHMEGAYNYLLKSINIQQWKEMKIIWSFEKKFDLHTENGLICYSH